MLDQTGFLLFGPFARAPLRNFSALAQLLNESGIALKAPRAFRFSHTSWAWK